MRANVLYFELHFISKVVLSSSLLTLNSGIKWLFQKCISLNAVKVPKWNWGRLVPSAIPPLFYVILHMGLKIFCPSPFTVYGPFFPAPSLKQPKMNLITSIFTLQTQIKLGPLCSSNLQFECNQDWFSQELFIIMQKSSSF